MIPVYQTTFGINGNCFAACLASVFEIELLKIPNLINFEKIKEDE